MNRLAILAAAAALAVPFSAAAASPDPVFDAFKSVCVAHAGDYVNTLKAADASGWANAAVTPPPDASVSVTDQAARTLTVAGENLTLLLNRGLQHMKSGNMPETNCRIESDRAHPGEIQTTQDWLAMKPDGGDATLAYFFVTGSPDKLVHIPGSSIPPGGMQLIKVQLDSNSTFLIDQFYGAK